jgi:hypothetical protein
VDGGNSLSIGSERVLPDLGDCQKGFIGKGEVMKRQYKCRYGCGYTAVSPNPLGKHYASVHNGVGKRAKLSRANGISLATIEEMFGRKAELHAEIESLDRQISERLQSLGLTYSRSEVQPHPRITEAA